MHFDSSSMPKLWFSRLVLFKSLHPSVVIRDIKLHRGLNIIVGRASRDPVLANNPMAMAGHSVGKTAFCRLLRYCLGEQRFSTENGEQRLRASLPYSWVGAELEIEATPWVVLRPLGVHKAPSFAQRETSIEELATETEKGSGFFEFCQELDKLLPSYVHHPEIVYKWEHLLGWLTRDQECRLRKFEVWRDNDSGSNSPSFRKPKEYPMHLVRGMLDLLAPEESKWSHTLSELTSRQANLREQQRIAVLDADYCYRDASKVLAEFIGEFPDTRGDSTLRFDGPITQARTRKSELLAEYAELKKQLEEAERNLFREKRYATNALERKNQIEALRIATPAPQINTDKPKTEYEEKKQKLAELSAKISGGGECLLVNQMPLAKCEYIAAYMKDLEQAEHVINLPDEQRKRTLTEMDSQRRERIQAIIKQQTDAEIAFKEALRWVDFYENERKDTLKKLTGLEKEMDRLERALQNFQYAERLNAASVQDTEIQRKKEEVEKIDSEIQDAKNQLDFYRGQSAKKDFGLQNLFDEIVHRVLKADYSGSVITSADGFAPQIRQDSVITGAAVESLSFILFDITSMLAPSRGFGQHPGFLVHDSPREADLDVGPYHSYLKELAAITMESGGEESAPFQYIVTTTTEPPTGIESFVKLSLAAHPVEKMLFKEQLKEKSLFTED